MKRMLVYMRDYVKESILGPLFKLFEATLELIVPLIIASIIDNGINASTPDSSYVIKMSVLLLVLGAVGLAFFGYCAVLCRKGIGRLRYQAEIFTFFSYTNAIVCRA